MQIPSEISLPVKKALSRLSIGDLTTGEMLAYLTDPRRKTTAFSPEIAERTVALLVSQGFLDDKRYLKLMVKRLEEKGYGPRRIRQELVRHRFPNRYIEAVMQREVNLPRRAVSFLQKKAGAEKAARSPEGRKKLIDSLVRFGYDYSTARIAVQAFSKTDDFE